MAAGEVAAPVRAANAAEKGAPSEPDPLALSLLLMRASTTGIVRLQLAMERCDRRVAIETLDELKQIDRRMGDLAESLPAEGLAAEMLALEAQQRALAVERLVLAAGTSGPQLRPISDRWVEQTPRAVPAEAGDMPACIAPEAAEEPRRDPAGLAIVLLMVAALMVGTAAFFFLTDAGRGLIGGVAATTGAG